MTIVHPQTANACEVCHLGQGHCVANKNAPLKPQGRNNHVQRNYCVSWFLEWFWNWCSCLSTLWPVCFCGQVNYDGELHKHPQLEADLAAVRDLYGHHAVSLRYLTILFSWCWCENILKLLQMIFYTKSKTFNSKSANISSAEIPHHQRSVLWKMTPWAIIL